MTFKQSKRSILLPPWVAHVFVYACLPYAMTQKQADKVGFTVPWLWSIICQAISPMGMWRLNPGNWFSGKGKGKGIGKTRPDLYEPKEGQQVLPFIEMNNRVQAMCRDFEKRMDAQKEQDQQAQVDKAVNARLEALGMPLKPK